MAELQLIPARHGTATFVPAGSVIKIINTHGTQVVDTWAFALPKPEAKKGSQEEKTAQNDAKKSQATPTKKKGAGNLPSQEEAEKATEEGMREGEDANAGTDQQKRSWGSYVPSIWGSAKKDENEQKQDSKTWSSYFPSGKGFSNYIPNTAKNTVSSVAQIHARDPNKSYMEQLQEFSKTPVGAAGLGGLSVLSGSGYGGSMYAGYQAWTAQKALAPAMEFMSMPHSRAKTCHLRPKVNDKLVSNVREPMLTIVEDTSGGVHDTLIAACDPARYKELNVENWEQHGSCSENLVLALKELNERAGLKGDKAVGGDVTVNTVPAPLNLFMNIPWDNDGDIAFAAPKSKEGGFVRMKAERDVVVVMSACPQDVININAGEPKDAHFIVEGEEDTAPAIKRTQVRKRPPPRKLSSSHATSTIASQAGDTPRPTPRKLPAKKPVPAAPKQAAQNSTPTPAKKPVPAAPKQAAQNATSATKQAAEESTPAPAQAQRAPKKYVPKKVVPKSKPAATTNNATANATGATSSGTATVEKKKPRKLNSAKPKPAAEG